jgi:hypothetical protein
MNTETPTESTREQIARCLRHTVFACARDWSAWQVGTMTENDFKPAWEDEDILNDLESVKDVQLTAALAENVAAKEHIDNLLSLIQDCHIVETPSWFTDTTKRAKAFITPANPLEEP